MISMASVGFRLVDRVYGLDQEQAQFLAGQMQRRLTVPTVVADLSDEIWVQSMRNPDAGETSADVVLDEERKRVLLEVMSGVKPDGDREAWDALVEALKRDLGEP